MDKFIEAGRFPHDPIDVFESRKSPLAFLVASATPILTGWLIYAGVVDLIAMMSKGWIRLCRPSSYPAAAAAAARYDILLMFCWKDSCCLARARIKLSMFWCVWCYVVLLLMLMLMPYCGIWFHGDLLYSWLSSDGWRWAVGERRGGWEDFCAILYAGQICRSDLPWINRSPMILLVRRQKIWDFFECLCFLPGN